MMHSIVTPTIVFVQSHSSLGFWSVALLLILLAQRAILETGPAPRAQRFADALSVLTGPLLLVAALTILYRIAELM